MGVSYSLKRGATKASLEQEVLSRGITGADLMRVIRTMKQEKRNKQTNSDTPVTVDIWSFNAGQLRHTLKQAGCMESMTNWDKAALVKMCNLWKIRGIDVCKANGLWGAPNQDAGGEKPRKKWVNRPMHGKTPPKKKGPYYRGRNFREYWDETEDFDVNFAEEWQAGGPGTPRRKTPSWSKIPAQKPQKQQLTPEPSSEEQREALMLLAVQEDWLRRGLSRQQAAQLLGTTLQPSKIELAEARRRLVMRWHPDRNKEDGDTAARALQITLAASKHFA